MISENENPPQPAENGPSITPLPEAPLPASQAERPPLHPDVLLRAGTGLGVVMVSVAFVWVNVFRQGDLRQALSLADLWALAPGLVLGVGFALCAWAVGRRLQATWHIVRLLEQSLDLAAMRFHHVVLFSLLAAFPEEVLFRGALQPEVGLLLASIVFGALHALTRLYFVYATGAGLLLGVLYSLSGTLWVSIGAHFAIDFVMLLLLLQRRHHVIR